MKTLLTSLCLTAIVILSSCAGGWTDEDKQNFLQGCREEQSSGSDTTQSNAYCRCELAATMHHYKTVPEVVINADSTALTSELLQCRTGK